MRKEIMDALTIKEKYTLCRLINEAAFTWEVMATLETLPYFKTEPVYQVVKEAAVKNPELKVLEYKIYNS
jgi:hypothetical protein